MINSGKFLADKLTEWLLETGFIQSQCQMSIYYKYTPDGTNIVVLSYFDDCVYRYTSEALGKLFVDDLGKIAHAKLLGYVHWFMSIIISQMRYHFIYLYQARYANSIVSKYLYTATVNTSIKFYKTTLTSDMILTKADASTSE